jgi:ABC-type nitrate/sulfonate/bicarbonate transport system permease component
MTGIVPTPLAVLDGFAGWIWGQPGLGLNPYLGTWVSNVSSSPVLGWFKAFSVPLFSASPLGLLIGWSKWVSKLLGSYRFEVLQTHPHYRLVAFFNCFVSYTRCRKHLF